MIIDRRQLVLAGSAALSGLSSAFAQSGEPLGFAKLYNNSLGCRVIRSAEFMYTFSQGELLEVMKKGEARAIVHRGASTPHEGYLIVHKHFEGLPLFVSRGAAVQEVELEKLREVLSGRVNNWRALGGSDAPIEIGFRADGVFRRALEFVLRGQPLDFATRSFAGSSYEELLAYGASRPGALLLGLRGASTRSLDLATVRLDGKTVATSESNAYPLSGEVSLLVRRNDPAAIDLGYQFADSLRVRSAEDGMGSAATPMITELEQKLQALQPAK